MSWGHISKLRILALLNRSLPAPQSEWSSGIIKFCTCLTSVVPLPRTECFRSPQQGGRGGLTDEPRRLQAQRPGCDGRRFSQKRYIPPRSGSQLEPGRTELVQGKQRDWRFVLAAWLGVDTDMGQRLGEQMGGWDLVSSYLHQIPRTHRT